MYSIFLRTPNTADVYLGLGCISHIAHSSVGLVVCKDCIFTPKRWEEFWICSWTSQSGGKRVLESIFYSSHLETQAPVLRRPPRYVKLLFSDSSWADLRSLFTQSPFFWSHGWFLSIWNTLPTEKWLTSCRKLHQRSRALHFFKSSDGM